MEKGMEAFIYSLESIGIAVVSVDYILNEKVCKRFMTCVDIQAAQAATISITVLLSYQIL